MQRQLSITANDFAARMPPQFRRSASAEVLPMVVHRFAAVLAVDIVEYTRLMSADEEGTYARYKSLRRELIDPKIAEFGARVVKSTGDGVLAEFRSALDAARCAIELQQDMADRNQDEPRDQRIVFRIGLSYGRIIVEPADIYGDEVNVAARLQTMAPPGGIAMSAKVAELIPDELCLALEDLGMQQLRNMGRGVHVYVYQQPQPTLTPIVVANDRAAFIGPTGEQAPGPVAPALNILGLRLRGAPQLPPPDLATTPRARHGERKVSLRFPILPGCARPEPTPTVVTRPEVSNIRRRPPPIRSAPRLRRMGSGLAA